MKTLKNYPFHVASIIFFVVVILIAGISPAFAQFTPTQNAYLNRNEILLNGDAEQGMANWLVTGSGVSVTTDHFTGSRSFEITIAGQTLSFCQSAVTSTNFKNSNLGSTCQIKTTNPNIQICNNLNGVNQDCSSVNNSGEWQASSPINSFIAGSTSGVCIISTIAITDVVKVDNCSLDEILALTKGGTGIGSSGVIGNVLTSNGSSWVSSPLPLFVNSINSLTTTQQFFSTGTVGNDFNIVSTIDTHTFNLPVASSTKSGKLSSTDWTVFNNKQDAIVILPVMNGGTGLSTIPLNNVILGNGISAVQSVAPSTLGNVLTSDGTTWISAPASGGGGSVTLFNSNDLTLSNADQISLSVVSTDVIQKWNIQGNSGAVTLSTTPFLGAVADGTEIKLIGNDDINTVEFTSNDIAGGCILNGNAVLKKYWFLTLVYDLSSDRYIEKSRNF